MKVKKTKQTEMDSLVTYQGGKQKYAKGILEILKPKGNFIDCCSGGGSITLRLLSQGYLPSNITMIDNGPMAKVFKKMEAGTLDIALIEDLCKPILSDLSSCHIYLKSLTELPFSEELYLVLQAGSFGGKHIYYDQCWKHSGFRSYWQPTETSSRRSPVNPMAPMPETLITRCEALQNMLNQSGLTVLDVDLNYFDLTSLEADSIFYIDPPYKGTTEYFNSFQYDCVVETAVQHFREVWLSEYGPSGVNSFPFLNTGKGGISGNRSKKPVEYLNKMK